MTKRKNWDDYYLDVTVRVSERSTCLSVKRGAILVKDKNMLEEALANNNTERMEFDTLFRR